MPTYEFRCRDCQRRTSVFVLQYQPPTGVVCEHCGSAEVRRLFSAPVHHRLESERLAEFDPSQPRGMDFYKDSRNVGLWAKKRAQELGVDLGSKMDEIVDKARSGDFLKE